MDGYEQTASRSMEKFSIVFGHIKVLKSTHAISE